MRCTTVFGQGLTSKLHKAKLHKAKLHKAKLHKTMYKTS